MQLRFITTRPHHGGLGIIGDGYDGHPAIESIGLDVPCNPAGQLLVGEGLGEGLVAGSQHGHEQMRLGQA
ncbi:MAG: hypothetical protein NT154_22670, partial [Verrucomicrobia bacterium]|nr:hypothetical protein [Verrucomicrobiota bacterium]